MVKDNLEKSGARKIADISGVSRSLTIEFTRLVNAAPMTTPTARSTTFPLKMNCLNPESILLGRFS